MNAALAGRFVSRRAWFTTALGGLVVTGCGWDPFDDPGSLRLATNWPLGQLGVLPARLLGRVHAVHGYDRLPQRRGRTGWAVLGGALDSESEAFTYEVGLWVDPERFQGPATWAALAEGRLRDRIALDDPTVARGPALAVAEELGESWSGEDYLRVLWAYGSARRPIAGLLKSPLALARGEVVAALGVRPSWLEPRSRFRPLESGLRGVEAFHVDASSRQAGVLRAALGLEAAARSDPEDPRLRSPQSARVRRIAILVRAACVEAHRELRAALGAVERAEFERPRAAERARYWLAQPPPWPPASVTRLRRQRDGDRLVADLIGHLAIPADERRALAAEWERPPRPIDGEILTGLRWADRPFFAAWLAAEWGAWCRQRYRRAARLAEGLGAVS